MADQSPQPIPSGPGALTALWHQGQLTYKLLRHRQVPVLLKLIPIVAVLYVLSPIDLVPDVALGLGQLDDLAIVLIALRTFIHLAPPDAVADAEGKRDATTVTTTYRVEE